MLLHMNEPRPKQTTWTKFRRRFLIAVVVFIWYVLSIGPMFWHYYEAIYLNGPTWLLLFYAPLRLLCNIPLFRKLIELYIQWWIL